jgi:transcriptional regulator with XRE-family HTH domain
MTIGERILQLVKEKGFTQMEFSRLTGIPQSTMSSWRSRKQNPGMDKLQIICDVLDVDPFFLISGSSSENTTSMGFLRIYDQDECDLILEYRRLDSGQKNRLLGYLQALSGDRK